MFLMAVRAPGVEADKAGRWKDRKFQLNSWKYYAAQRGALEGSTITPKSYLSQEYETS